MRFLQLLPRRDSSVVGLTDFQCFFAGLRLRTTNVRFLFLKCCSLEAPTCKRNLYKLLRALSLGRPLLLEGPPGGGKSSLVIELAKNANINLTRLNLSDQTDLSDLFGTDMPFVNGRGEQSFRWCDGPLLKAIKNGHWILLDEV